MPVILVASWPRWRPVDRGPGATLPPAGAGAGVPAPVPALPEPDTLDDEALCHAWRVSLWQLQEAPTTEVLDAVVRQRQRYLDELASRHPSEVERWLQSGPRPGEQPAAVPAGDAAGGVTRAEGQLEGRGEASWAGSAAR